MPSVWGIIEGDATEHALKSDKLTCSMSTESIHQIRTKSILDNGMDTLIQYPDI